MKILFLNHSMRCGGAERVTANLANEWASRGREVVIATLTSTEGDFYELDGGVRRVALNLEAASRTKVAGMLQNIRRLLAVRRVMRTEKPDVVIGVMTVPSILAIIAGIGLDLSVIATEHNHPPMLPVGALWDCLRRWTFRHASAVIALTGETAAWLEKHCKCPNVSVIPNPVFVPTAGAEPELLPQDIVAADDRLLLAVGRLVPQKGFDLLIKAFAKIHATTPQWKLVILGEGPQREALQAIARECGVEGTIEMPGKAGNIGDWYERADLYVLSSRFEGFSLTLAEAMASGCPAVSYDCDVGPRDIVRHDIDGVLVSEVGSETALADALLDVMTDERRRLRMAANAGDVANRFAPARIIAQWNDLFTKSEMNRRA
jgi:glycosyltransferase involved in cell wall biosynthesis